MGITIRPRSSTLLTIPVAVPDICLRRRRSLASVDRGHSLRSLYPPPAALPSLPSCFHISFSFYDTFDGRQVAAPTCKNVGACLLGRRSAARNGRPSVAPTNLTEHFVGANCVRPPTIILQITLLVSVKEGDLYCNSLLFGA